MTDKPEPWALNVEKMSPKIFTTLTKLHKENFGAPFQKLKGEGIGSGSGGLVDNVVL